MNDIQTSLDKLRLTRPDPERDAPFALSWFESSYGKETLLIMGNPESTIQPPTLENEKRILRDFLKLEKDNSQLTWMMRYDDKTIGAVWLNLKDTKYTRSPAFNIMIGDKAFRNMGIGKIVTQEMINYAKNVLHSEALYSRYLTNNVASAHLHAAFGFAMNGPAYNDNDGLEFQNVKLEF